MFDRHRPSHNPDHFGPPPSTTLGVYRMPCGAQGDSAASGQEPAGGWSNSWYDGSSAANAARIHSSSPSRLTTRPLRRSSYRGGSGARAASRSRGRRKPRRRPCCGRGPKTWPRLSPPREGNGPSRLPGALRSHLRDNADNHGDVGSTVLGPSRGIGANSGASAVTHAAPKRAPQGSAANAHRGPAWGPHHGNERSSGGPCGIAPAWS